MTSPQKFGFKITVIGDGRVGKTSLIKKFTKGSFKNNYVRTIGAQFSEFDKEIEGDLIRLIFWDIAGQDEFHFIRPSFYNESKAAIIVYSLEENDFGKRSFENIKRWNNEVQQHCGDIPTILFANKVDLVDEDTFNDIELKKIVDDQNFLTYYLTSAKTGQGVYEAFNAIINKLYKEYKEIVFDS
ncbi:MAG: Rab family GTPase, partial [Promethearchaeota archaeon]